MALLTTLSVSVMLFHTPDKLAPTTVEADKEEGTVAPVIVKKDIQVVEKVVVVSKPEKNMPPSFIDTQYIIDENEAELFKQKNEYQLLLQKSLAQTQQLEALLAKNSRLQEQLDNRDRFIEEQEENLASIQIENQQLQESLVEAQQTQKAKKALVSNNQQVKDSIDRKPDLVKNVNKPVSSESQETKLPEEELYDPFSGSVEFGFSYDQDNNTERAIEGTLVLDYEVPEQYKLHNDLYIEFEDEDGKTQTSKQRWQLQGDYNLAPQDFIYVRTDLQRSRFASYEQEDVYAVGYGRIVINTKTHILTLEAGPGYKTAKPNEGEDEITIDEAIIRAYFSYSFVFSDALQLTSQGAVETGKSNTTYNAIVKAQNRIYQQLYLVFDVDYKYTTTVPDDSVNREVSSGVNLLYAF